MKKSNRGYKCHYKYCTHPQDILYKQEDERGYVSDNYGKLYHEDCWYKKVELEDLRKFYGQFIDSSCDMKLIAKVLNDLVFKYGLEIDYIRYALNYYAQVGKKFKSPFALLYLRSNKYMRKHYEESKAK